MIFSYILPSECFKSHWAFITSEGPTPEQLLLGVQQKVHGVLITPCGPQLNSSQDKVHLSKFMHNGIQ